MTDEEKIKKARGIICHDCRWNECDNDSCPTLRDTVKAIELGLAEGRKELVEKNEELKNMASKQVDAILKLYDQIEEMKNFYNCAHSSRALCPNEHKCKGCKDWKIAE